MLKKFDMQSIFHLVFTFSCVGMWSPHYKKKKKEKKKWTPCGYAGKQKQRA